jgi:hypothetical protein
MGKSQRVGELDTGIRATADRIIAVVRTDSTAQSAAGIASSFYDPIDKSSEALFPSAFFKNKRAHVPQVLWVRQWIKHYLKPRSDRPF